MIIIIAGGRNFNDYPLLKKYCDFILSDKTDIVIVSGKAPGADSLGERYAIEKGYPILEFPAKWDDLNVDKCVVKVNRFGKQYNALAGHNRNEEMAKVADGLILFWDGKSTGSGNMLELAENYKLRIRGFCSPTFYYWLDKTLPFVKKGLKRVKYNQRRMNHNKYDEFIYSAPLKIDAIKWLNQEKKKQNLFGGESMFYDSSLIITIHKN